MKKLFSVFKNSFSFSLSVFVSLSLSLSVSANISLPAIISNNMVLQQKSSVKLWGWGNGSEKLFVTTSWNHKTDSVKVNENNKWEINVQTPAAGGPYTITFRARNTIV